MNFKLLIILFLAMITSTSSNAQDIQSLGKLHFNSDGILFAGDNVSGAVLAFNFTSEITPSEAFEINIYNVDAQIASILGTLQDQIQINDIAVHPTSREVFISVTRGHGDNALPALLKVDAENNIHTIDLSKVEFTSQSLLSVPHSSHKLALRGSMGSPPTKKDIAKSKQSLRILTVVDMEFYKGELIVAGLSNEDFNSVLRRLPYPFEGEESISSVEMYHIAHDQYESRAPIRSMVIKNINGRDQLVAAYTCSPLVLIPLEDITHNTKVKARTIGDMGNGQPIDIVPFKLEGEEMLFVTNNSRSPRVIPVKGLHNAKVVSKEDFERGPKLDLGPIIPYGPMGQSIMFTGASLRIDLLNDHQFVSLNRDIETGSLDLVTFNTKMPFKMHNIVGEFDIPTPSSN